MGVLYDSLCMYFGTYLKSHYRIAGDAGDSLFSVSSTGAVNAIGNLDRESLSSYTINVDVSAYKLLIL